MNDERTDQDAEEKPSHREIGCASSAASIGSRPVATLQAPRLLRGLGYDSMAAAVRATRSHLLDALFPWRCVGCDAPAASILCDRCLERTRWIADPMCPRCGLPLASTPAHLCERCAAAPPAFGRVRALAVYRTADEEGAPLGACLRALKYGRRRALAADLSRLLAERSPFAAGDHDLVMPVPLHPARLRERGFNQALLLAREPARRLGLPIDARSLVRLRATVSQVGLDERGRRHNLRAAFALRRPTEVRGRRVLLVDDVVTSTATAAACAHALRAAGTAAVDVLAVARSVLA